MGQGQRFNTPASKDVLAVILAGGRGARLHELTEHRAKPGLEFAGNYRIIDFTLSNCVNSNIKQIGVLTQYKSQHLMRHLIHSWTGLHQGFGEFLELLPACQQLTDQWYQGTADALFQNAQFIADVGSRITLILSGDHIYKMDYRPFIEQHKRNNAALTIACLPVDKHLAAGKFGVLEVDCDNRIIGFEEKPQNPATLPDDDSKALASMGIYVFDTEFLLRQLSQDANIQLSDHDFGKNIIPSVLRDFKVFAYPYTQADGSEAYWQDVGTLDSYWQANMAMLSNHSPLQFDDPNWPIWSQQTCLAPAYFHPAENRIAPQIENALICAGSDLTACYVKDSVISPHVQIQHNASVCDSVILPNVTIGKGAIVHRALVDNGCHIPAGMRIGVDKTLDQQRGFRVTQGGIVLVCQSMLDSLNVVPKDQTKRSLWGAQQDLFSLSFSASDELRRSKTQCSLQ